MKQQATFSIRNKKVILYGAASIGRITCDKYKEAGLPVECFIDKRSKEIPTFKGYRVFSLSDKEIIERMNDDYYVLVSVKNVFEHSNIANQLIELGFRNIVFMPLSAINGHGNREQNQLYKAYLDLVSGRFENVDELPKSFTKDMYVPHNESVIQENETAVTAFISIDQLYTDRKKRKTPWFSRPVVCLLPHIDLFRYIAGDHRYTCERYMAFCIESATNSDIAITEAWKSNIIKNRSMVYEHMAHSMELDSDFFVRNAPVVSYDHSSGVFNLNSGKHRSAFYASLKRKYIPVQIDKSDYERYLNLEAVEELSEFLTAQGIDELSAPIPHPYFFNYPCETNEFYYGFMYWLMYQMAENVYSVYGDLDFSRLAVLCAMDDYGFIERTIIRAGASVTVVESGDAELGKKIDRLLTLDTSQTRRVSEDAFLEQLSSNENDLGEYDYIIVDAVKYPQLLKTDPGDRQNQTKVLAVSKDEMKDRESAFESVARGEFRRVYCL